MCSLIVSVEAWEEEKEISPDIQCIILLSTVDVLKGALVFISLILVHFGFNWSHFILG